MTVSPQTYYSAMVINSNKPRLSARCRGAVVAVALLVVELSLPTGLVAAQDMAIPPQNQAGLKQPPARPPADSAEARARMLFDAIVHDDPKLAQDVFFPRAAFLLVKAMADPGHYYDRLQRRFERDIHALHQSSPELQHATFERLELVRRGGFVREGEEGNHLPYWASRHSWLHYRVGQSLRKIEVRVLITWGNDWYVIHLNEFK